jgi:hypothetical protein
LHLVVAAVLALLAQVLLWDMIDPRGPFRTHWDLVLLVLLLYIAVATPVYVCFHVHYHVGDPLGIVEVFVTLVLLMDVYLNFRTGIISEWWPWGWGGVSPCGTGGVPSSTSCVCSKNAVFWLPLE